MRLEHVKIHAEHDDHFVVQHKDGTPFKVAKSGMSKANLEKIQQHMAFGGTAKGYADGGQVDPNDIPFDQIPASSGPAMPSSADSVPTPAPAFGNYLGNPSDTGQALESQSPAQSLLSQPTQSSPPAQQPQEVELPPLQQSTQAPRPASAGGGGDLEKEARRAGGQYDDAEKQVGQVAADKAQAMSDFWTSRVAQMQDQMKQTQQRFNDSQRMTDQAIGQYMNGKIDPNRFLNSRSTLQTIGNSIAMVLGGIGSGMTGQPNAAAQVQSDAIKRDVEAQTQNLDKQKNAVSMFMQRGHSIQESQQLAYNMLSGIADAKREQMAAQFGGPEALALARQNSAVNAQNRVKEISALRDQQLGRQKDALDIQLKKMELGMQLNARPIQMAAESGQAVPAQAGMYLDAKRRVRNADGTWSLANTDKDRDELADLGQAYKNGMAAIKQYEDLGSTTGLGGADTDRGRFAVQNALNSYQAILGRSNAPRGAQEEQLEKALTNPTSMFTNQGAVSARAKLFKDVLNRHMMAAQSSRLIGGTKAAAGAYGGQ